MIKFKNIIAAVAVMAMTASYASAQKIAITAHRGNWDCEEGGYARNSVAALKAAQDNGYWGSEFDVQMTKDFKLIVHHDPSVAGVSIWDHNWADFSKARLENGETIPTLDEYLTQGEKSKCVLVCELKNQKTLEHEMYMTDLVVNAFKGHNLLDPKRVIFISFSFEICKRLTLLCPGFTVQYLGSDISPDQLKAAGINGVDFHFSVFGQNPTWYKQARDNGMSINSWTCNSEEEIELMIKQKVDCITTDEPQRVRRLMRKSKERKQGR
ncbi:MAG: glycerophosphodiester phosphodiesterase [Bacteroidales bacterium]|nr:glycerophosphodiester phosphodiesterase [Bacteroidales bacterium]